MAVKTIGVVRGSGHQHILKNKDHMQDKSADFIAITPADTARLCGAGLDVWVEEGAGVHAGFDDAAYAIAGASLEHRSDIFKGCDFIIAASTLDISEDITPDNQVSQDAVICCPSVKIQGGEQSFHFLNTREMRESPKIQSDMEILGRTAMAEALAPYIATASMVDLDIRILGWSPLMRYALRRAGNRDPKSIELVPDAWVKKDLTALGINSLYIYDSRHFDDDKKLVPYLKSKGCHLFDLKDFIDDQGDESVQMYREDHPPYDMGGLLIDFDDLSGTMAARHALDLIGSRDRGAKAAEDLNVVVIGYGSCVQAALDTLKSEGVGAVSLLGRKNVSGDRFHEKLAQADLILLGKIKLPQARGALFDQDILSTGLSDGTVIMDFAMQDRIDQGWIKGCAPSPCGYFMSQNDIYLAQGADWATLSHPSQVSSCFSAQMTDILIGRENLAHKDAIDYAKGIKQALS